MEFTPEPGNSLDELDLPYQVVSIAIAGARPLKLDLGGVSLFETIGALRAALRLCEDVAQDFIECDELDFDEEDDE